MTWRLYIAQEVAMEMLMVFPGYLMTPNIVTSILQEKFKKSSHVVVASFVPEQIHTGPDLRSCTERTKCGLRIHIVIYS